MARVAAGEEEEGVGGGQGQRQRQLGYGRLEATAVGEKAEEVECYGWKRLQQLWVRDGKKVISVEEEGETRSKGGRRVEQQPRRDNDDWRVVVTARVVHYRGLASDR
ncbi:hypothetical protein BHM03_00047749 [Ensete ventricosum]|nr:hypothetical protein BHM03_00047749 [Ensete ventricosum]